MTPRIVDRSLQREGVGDRNNRPMSIRRSVSQQNATGWARRLFEVVQPFAWARRICNVEYSLVEQSPLALAPILPGLSSDHVFDLIFGRCSLFLGIDLGSFIGLAKENGFLVRWSSRKEAARLLKGTRMAKIDGKPMIPRIWE